MKTVKLSDLSPDELEEGIANALKDKDIKAVEVLIRALAVYHPDRAQAVLDTLELGVSLARGVSAKPQAEDGQR